MNRRYIYGVSSFTKISLLINKKRCISADGDSKEYSSELDECGYDTID